MSVFRQLFTSDRPVDTYKNVLCKKTRQKRLKFLQRMAIGALWKAISVKGCRRRGVEGTRFRRDEPSDSPSGFRSLRSRYLGTTASNAILGLWLRHIGPRTSRPHRDSAALRLRYLSRLRRALPSKNKKSALKQAWRTLLFLFGGGGRDSAPCGRAISVLPEGTLQPITAMAAPPPVGSFSFLPSES